jgi:hypothetical protein
LRRLRPSCSLALAIAALALSVPQRASCRSLYFGGAAGGGADRVEIPLRGAGEAGVPVWPADADFTLEFWVRGYLAGNLAPAPACGFGPGGTDGNVLFELSRADSRKPSIVASLGAGRVSFHFGADAPGARTACGETMVLDGAWHHVALDRRIADGSLSIWVDGRLDGRLSPPEEGAEKRAAGGDESEAPDGACIALGGRSGAPLAGFRGWLDEFRISRSLRYTGPFSPPAGPFGPDAETIALYHLDEEEGERVLDSSGGASGPSDGVLRCDTGSVPRRSHEIPFRTGFAGMPTGAVLEAYPNPELGQTILFARFPEPREGEITVTIHDGEGRLRSEITGTLSNGSAMFVWDGRALDGSEAAPGAYVAKLAGSGARPLATGFVLR